jgi:AcrR family transcriptional regulator
MVEDMPKLNQSNPSGEPVNRRIMSAALDLFVERGYHNVSVHDVQKQANVSIGSIYNHFGGKEGIAKALYYHLVKELEQTIEAVMAEEISFRERCNRIIALLFEYTETQRNTISFMLHAKHREFLPDEPPICSSSPFKLMRSIVEQGIHAGEIRNSDPWAAASTVFGGAIRMIQLRLDGIIEQPLTTYYDELLSCMWGGMGTENRPSSQMTSAG